LKYGDYHLSGVTSSRIYLGNRNPIPHVFVINYSYTDTQHIQIAAPFEFGWRGMHVDIDSPNIYLIDEHTPSILHSNIIFDKTGAFNKIDCPGFSSFIPISPRSQVFRAYNIKYKRNILVKKINDSSKLQLAPDILKKQIDGVFCTDGMLMYNSKISKIIYTFYYRNEIICMDTNLNVLYKTKTIDTTSHSHIKVANVRSTNTSTLSAPPFSVNKRSCISEKWIFVNSALQADNESIEMFKSHEVIDVYSIKDGQYQFSFYLQKDNEKVISQFKVVGDKMIVLLNDSFIQLYKLNF
jgi:hypothetical protein